MHVRVDDPQLHSSAAASAHSGVQVQPSPLHSGRGEENAGGLLLAGGLQIRIKESHTFGAIAFAALSRPKNICYFLRDGILIPFFFRKKRERFSLYWPFVLPVVSCWRDRIWRWFLFSEREKTIWRILPPRLSLASLFFLFTRFFSPFDLALFILWVFVWTKLLKGGTGSERGGSGKDGLWADILARIRWWPGNGMCVRAPMRRFIFSGLGFLVLLPLLPPVPLPPSTTLQFTSLFRSLVHSLFFPHFISI